MNKKAWLRIVEAFIAIILILSVAIVVYSKNIEQPRRADEIYNLEKVILDEISFEENLRNAVLAGQNETLENFVEGKMAGRSFNYSIKICSIEDICSLPYYKKEIYAKDRIISSNLSLYLPKKIKIFIWIER